MSPDASLAQIQRALDTGSMDQLRAAVDQGGSIPTYEMVQGTSVIIDMLRSCHEKNIELPAIHELIRLGAQPNQPGVHGLAPLAFLLVRMLHDAGYLTQGVISLLSAGAHVDALIEAREVEMSWRPRSVDTLAYPLSLAIQLGCIPVAQALLMGGANPNGPSHRLALSPLAVAALWKEEQIAAILLSKGANPNAAGVDGLTPFHYCWDEKLASLLLKSGACVSTCDRQGRVPLHEWVERCVSPEALVWLSCHAPEDRFRADHKGLTPFDILRNRADKDLDKAHWLIPLVAQWEADWISSGTRGSVVADNQSRRL